MATPFDKLTRTQLHERLRAQTPAWLDTNEAFYRGDHWQGGAGWTGPRPGPKDPPEVMGEIARAFVSQNVVKETVGRHAGGVVGREPAWSYTPTRPLKPGKQPTAKEQGLIDEAEAALTTWWDTRGAHQLLQEAVKQLLRSERVTLRIFVPDGERDAAGQIPVGTLAQSLERIFVEVCGPAQAGVITDTATQRQAGVYLAEVQREASDGTMTKEAIAEVSAVDRETGLTELRVVSDAEAAPYAFGLGGRILHHALERDALISEQVRQLQRQVNLARTMLSRNVVVGGFLERVLLNAQLPGKFVDDPTAESGKRFEPDPAMQVGPGKTSYLTGVPIRDELGKTTGYASPSVVYRDPVPVDTFEATERSAYRAILQETQQLHALISGDAAASGESRRQALADFATSLLETAPAVQRATRWLLETVLALASVFAGTARRFDELRAVVTCRLDLGAISADEQRLVMELVAAKLLSRATAMSRIGVEDVDAEQAAIDAETPAAPAPAPQGQGGQPTQDDPAQGADRNTQQSQGDEE